MARVATARNIKFAHVGSLATVDVLSPHSDMEMFLAPLALRSHQYADYCAKRSQSVFTTLDSGALEVSIGTESAELTDIELLDLAIDLGVQEVVCSDCPNDPSKSLLRTRDFIRAWSRLPNDRRPQLMIVPHGTSYVEWAENAHKLIQQVGSCTVGIPRLFSARCSNGRPEFRIEIAAELKRRYPRIDVHLLGAGREFLLELRMLGSHGSVRSLDSTFLHRYAYTGEDPFSTYVAPLKMSDSVAAPIEFQARASRLSALIEAALEGRSKKHD